MNSTLSNETPLSVDFDDEIKDELAEWIDGPDEDGVNKPSRSILWIDYQPSEDLEARHEYNEATRGY